MHEKLQKQQKQHAVTAAKITLCNAYGPSDTHCFYSATGNADGSFLTDSGLIWPSGLTGATPGSGGGGAGPGGGCPTPDMLVLLASGLRIPAGDLQDGMVVIGVNDNTLEPMTGTVRNPQVIGAVIQPVMLEDGRVLTFSARHRVAVEGQGWIQVEHLHAGDSLIAEQPSIVSSFGKTYFGQVVTFLVDGCHTYFCEVLCHNKKSPV